MATASRPHVMLCDQHGKSDLHNRGRCSSGAGVVSWPRTSNAWWRRESWKLRAAVRCPGCDAESLVETVYASEPVQRQVEELGVRGYAALRGREGHPLDRPFVHGASAQQQARCGFTWVSRSGRATDEQQRTGRLRPRQPEDNIEVYMGLMSRLVG